MTLEEEALLGVKNPRHSHYESLSDSSARMLGVAVSSSARELDNTLSIQQPDDKPHVHIEFVEGLPIWRATMLVVNSALGAGILNFPLAYAECGGIATAFTIQMVGVFLKQFWTKIFGSRREVGEKAPTCKGGGALSLAWRYKSTILVSLGVFHDRTQPFLAGYIQRKP